MPPNSPQTSLPLETFRQIINWHPFYFYQLARKDIPLTDSADLVVSEYTWQRPMAASRSDFRRAIASAEQKLTTLLNYDVVTRYRSESCDPGYLRRISGPAQTRYSGYGSYGYGGGYYGAAWPVGSGPALVKLDVGKLQKIATVSYSELVKSAAITYTDGDGDDVNDTFTATFADTTSDPALVIVAFSPDDRPANSGSAASSSPVDWQIRPVTVTRLDSNTLQVIGPSWLLVKPTLYEKATPAAGYNSNQTGVSSSGTFDPNQTGNFVTGLTAYLKVYSNINQATFVRRYGTEEYTSQVDVTVVDADLGHVQVNLWPCYSTAPSCWPGPMTEELRINYEAGATTANYQQSGYLPYQGDWDQIVARFAIAELAQVPAATQKQNPALFHWREDLAHTGSASSPGVGDTYRISNQILNNPFRNTRRGAVEAFLAISSLAQHRAVNF